MLDPFSILVQLHQHTWSSESECGDDGIGVPYKWPESAAPKTRYDQTITRVNLTWPRRGVEDRKPVRRSLRVHFLPPLEQAFFRQTLIVCAH